jgi:hypothetical protein
MTARRGVTWVTGGLTLVVFFLGTCLASKAGLAQDWTLSSQIQQRMTYNSNLLLTPQSKVSTFGSLTTPELTLQRNSPTSNVTLDGKFKFAEYFGHSELNSDGQLLNANATKQLSERSTVSLEGDFDRDTTLTSDQDITGQFLTKPIRFITWDVAPSYAYQLSPIDTLTWSGSYQNTSYKQSGGLALKTDYEYYGTSLDYEHQLSELASVTGELSYFRFVPDDLLNTRQDIYGGLVGYRYTPSERFLISGQVGVDYNVTHQDEISTGFGSTGGNSTDVGYRLKFNMNYNINDQTSTAVALSHDVQPSGDGRLETRNTGTLSLNYQLGEETTIKLDATYSDNQDYFGLDTNSQASEGQSRYFTVGPTLSWNLREDMTLEASYQLRHKSSKDQGSATDNAAFLTFRYALPDQDWSGF